MDRNDLHRIARLRVKEAKILLDAGYYAGAYYLLGYAVECALKACIAKQINRYQFPDRKLINDSYTHNLEKLLNLSGLKDELESDCKSTRPLEVNWTLVKDWRVDSRYSDSMSELKAIDFYSAVTARSVGILSWVKKRW